MIFNDKDKNKGINYSLKNLLINFNKDKSKKIYLLRNEENKKQNEIRDKYKNDKAGKNLCALFKILTSKENGPLCSYVLEERISIDSKQYK